MKQGIVIKDKVAMLIVMIVFVSMVGLMLACAEPVRHLQPLPASPWGDTYSYRYDPAEKKPSASVQATIIVVNPAYKEIEESVLREKIYSKVGRGFSASMGVDMDKIIVAKGMTSKGPYASLEDVTYSDKKVSDLTLAPKVYITTEIKYGKWEEDSGYNEENQYITRSKRHFDMKIGGWISFAMQEPMSGQKMWVKKLDLEEITMSGEEYAESKNQYNSRGQWVGYSEKETVYDGKIDAVADTLKKMYPIIMQKCWTYIDAEEILSLKDKVKEIRDLKRY